MDSKGREEHSWESARATYPSLCALPYRGGVDKRHLIEFWYFRYIYINIVPPERDDNEKMSILR